jgi:hypothetical protein
MKSFAIARARHQPPTLVAAREAVATTSVIGYCAAGLRPSGMSEQTRRVPPQRHLRTPAQVQCARPIGGAKSPDGSGATAAAAAALLEQGDMHGR